MPEIKVSIDEEAVARAAATLREAGKQLSQAFGRVQGLAVEPWIIDTPRGPRQVYIDNDNQEHFDPPGEPWETQCREDQGWRKLYVEKKAAE